MPVYRWMNIWKNIKKNLDIWEPKPYRFMRFFYMKPNFDSKYYTYCIDYQWDEPKNSLSELNIFGETAICPWIFKGIAVWMGERLGGKEWGLVSIRYLLYGGMMFQVFSFSKLTLVSTIPNSQYRNGMGFMYEVKFGRT